MFKRRERIPEIDVALANRLFKDCFTKETAAANYLDLADKCGVDSKTAERWLNGKQRPGSRNLALLAKALGCTVRQLLGNDSHPLREVIGAENLVERREETAEKENEENSKELFSFKIMETPSKVIVTLKGDKESYSKYFPVSVAEALVKCLANVGIAAEKEKIVHLNTEFGSIILTFEMPAEWAKALELAARNGELREFGITDVQVVDNTQKIDVSDQTKEGESTSSEESRPNPVEGELRPNTDDSLETQRIDEGSEKPPVMSQDDFSADLAPEGIEINLLNDPRSASNVKKLLASLRDDDDCEVGIVSRDMICSARSLYYVVGILRSIVPQFPVGFTSVHVTRGRHVLGVRLKRIDAKRLVSAFDPQTQERLGIIGISTGWPPSQNTPSLVFNDMSMLEQWLSQHNRRGELISEDE